MSEMLFQRLDAEEHAGRELVSRLRAEIAEAEERLAALAITRRTATQLLEGVPQEHATESGPPAKNGSGASPRPSMDDASETTRLHEESSLGKQQPSMSSSPLTGLNQKVVTLVASADRPMSPKDVVTPLVDKSAPRQEIERMRHRLNRLVNKGYLKQVGPGLYTGAEVDR
ncbi:hypothetical protein [Streptomyces sp. NPDC059479]|uniref:hypothetical protein n=1 Tax=Streptomyces sp. NPDC059479 TaxID=3346848 RepID=UPI0036B2D73E